MQQYKLFIIIIIINIVIAYSTLINSSFDYCDLRFYQFLLLEACDSSCYDCTCYPDMLQELDRVAPVLLTKVGETNKFIREDAEKALMAMVENTTTQRALSSVTSFGAT